MSALGGVGNGGDRRGRSLAADLDTNATTDLAAQSPEGHATGLPDAGISQDTFDDSANMSIWPIPDSVSILARRASAISAISGRNAERVEI